MFDMMPFGFNRSDDLFGLTRDFNSLFSSMMNQAWGKGMSTDIQDRGDHYLIESELPGVRKEDIKLSLNGDILTIRADYNRQEKSENKDYRYVYRERSSGSYQRSFSVSEIDQDGIKASYEDGILKLVLPKKQPEQQDDGSIEINID